MNMPFFFFQAQNNHEKAWSFCTSVSVAALAARNWYIPKVV
jgi:hypothetical protein